MRVLLPPFLFPRYYDADGEETEEDQCVNNIDLGPPPADQDVQVIRGESNYWQEWEKEACFNSGQTHARELIPQHLSKTINETTGQLANPEHGSEGRLLIAEPGGEYVEEHCDDPLADKKDTKLNCHDAPLDLTIEADR